MLNKTWESLHIACRSLDISTISTISTISITSVSRVADTGSLVAEHASYVATLVDRAANTSRKELVTAAFLHPAISLWQMRLCLI